MSVETTVLAKAKFMYILRSIMRFQKLLSGMRAAQPAYDRPHHSAGAYFFKIGTLFFPSLRYLYYNSICDNKAEIIIHRLKFEA